MKLINMPIDVLCTFTKSGKMEPLRIKILKEDGESDIISINKFYSLPEEKFNGNVMRLFRCESIHKNKEFIYELKYELNTCSWILYKI